jgi:hypothetical protein
MNKEKLNCSNCGAPITSKTCSYCGTTFTNYIDEDEELREFQYLLRKKEIDLAQMRQTEFIMQDINNIQLFNYRGYK